MSKSNINKSDNRPIFILITDIQLHATQMNNPNNFSRKIEKSLKNHQSGRYYNATIPFDKNGKLVFAIDLPENVKGREIKLMIPENGIPICLGKDTIEKFKSLKMI